MKKFAAFAAVLTVMLLIGMTAMAAPLENPNLDVTPIDAFTNWSNGDVLGNNENGWIFKGSSLSTFNNGLVVLESADPDTAFTGRINLAEKISAEDMSKATGVAFYIENNSDEEAGVGFFGEHAAPPEYTKENGETVLTSHQLTYSGADFFDVTCYLVDLEGNITRGQEYYDYNTDGLASVPAGFKGWFLIDLANGGFNQCIYGSWGPDSGSGHSSEDCNNGAYVKGESILTAVGYSICGDLMEGDTIVFGDYALWSAKEGFTMPEDGGSSDSTPTPGNGSTEQPTNAATENATSAPSASATAGTSAPASNNTILYIVIAAVVVAVVVIIVVVM
ncbi:MAG: hypothetical protein KH354_03185 [Clostridiales bacterium]|nr:hypothetical protein [Clostridiales bacterium]